MRKGADRMTLVKHELRRGWKMTAIWTAAIGFFISICIFMFPEMASEMKTVSKIFASMGAFTAAFGMDRLNFGTLIGFYAIECGNILGIGGALYAALTASNLLCSEEKDHTAEFLLTQPVTRTQVVTGKLLAMFILTAALNAVCFLLAVGSVACIGENIPWKELWLLHLACFLVQLELEGICFGMSAFLRRSGMGQGMGIAICLYFLNILANLSKSAHFLKYFTPFAYAEGADVLSNGALDTGLILLGLCVTLAGIAAAYWQYRRKDISG